MKNLRTFKPGLRKNNFGIIYIFYYFCKNLVNMAAPLRETLKSMLRTIEALGERLEESRRETEILRAENNEMRLKVEELSRKLDKALTDVEFLTLSHRLADSPDSLIETRRHIARLIRNIDKSISMLSSD